jgi:hypothetical protein
MTGKLVRAIEVIQVFVVGGAVMGYEMVASRFLYPYFGNGINTWALLISTVLLALAAGYFCGGIALRKSDASLLSASAVTIAGLYLFGLSFLVNRALETVSDLLGDGFLGILAGSLLIAFVPVASLGSLAPAFVTLFARDIGNVGLVSGWIYSLSALGNVCGILATTFLFIPQWGSRAITMGFGVALVISGVLFWICRHFRYRHHG